MYINLYLVFISFLLTLIIFYRSYKLIINSMYRADSEYSDSENEVVRNNGILSVFKVRKRIENDDM